MNKVNQFQTGIQSFANRASTGDDSFNVKLKGPDSPKLNLPISRPSDLIPKKDLSAGLIAQTPKKVNLKGTLPEINFSAKDLLDSNGDSRALANPVWSKNTGASAPNQLPKLEFTGKSLPRLNEIPISDTFRNGIRPPRLTNQEVRQGIFDRLSALQQEGKLQLNDVTVKLSNANNSSLFLANPLRQGDKISGQIELSISSPNP
jgi:hypothetical protein